MAAFNIVRPRPFHYAGRSHAATSKRPRIADNSSPRQFAE